MILQLLAIVSVGDDFDFSEFKSIPVLHGERYKPLDTFARQFFWTIANHENPRDLEAKEPTEALLKILSDSTKYSKFPLIKVENEKIKLKLGFPRDKLFFSAEEIWQKMEVVEDQLKELRRDETEKGPNYTALFTLKKHYFMITHLLAGSSIYLLPMEMGELSLLDITTAAKENGTSNHFAIVFREYPKERLELVSGLFNKLLESFRNGDRNTFFESSRSLKNEILSLTKIFLGQLEEKASHIERARERFSELVSVGAGNTEKMNLEIVYNNFRPVYKASMVYMLVLGAIVILAILRRNLWFMPTIILGFAIILHGYDFILRHLISGRQPWSNMYESLLAVSIAISITCLILELFHKTKIFAMAGAVLSPLIILVANSTPVFDPYISQLVPALKSFWMTIHVPAMMFAYGACAVMAVVGHIMLFRILLGKDNDAKIEKHMYRAHQVATLFLLLGISLGAVWAGEAWGRPWGWDMKEVWALISFLFYLFLLHGRLVRFVKGIGYAIGSVIGFNLVIYTYYGVNFLSTGLHSYGFSSGSVLSIFIFYGVELLLILVSLAFYMGRNARLQQAG